MWKSMCRYHEAQNHIVQQVSGLVNRSGNGDPTSELHRLATRDLESVVSAWSSSFYRLIKFQRDFIRSLDGWFELTLILVSNDNVEGSMEPSTKLEKKASTLRSIEGKDNGHVLGQDPLADKKLEHAACQRRMEDENLWLSKAIEETRAVILNSLQPFLSRVFEELIGLSVSLDTVCPVPRLEEEEEVPRLEDVSVTLDTVCPVPRPEEEEVPRLEEDVSVSLDIVCLVPRLEEEEEVPRLEEDVSVSLDSVCPVLRLEEKEEVEEEEDLT
ncbi:hypothetical protein SLEP1_g23856 [Rubroshorea leprosula]|uniref:DUF632 domain-containing protein n=1 Tax=Rubroshorea leprosula TaxID=152421 RepID=A0AAV5JN81_9ROSI|nr:hypothetical protein SLEP1_g23856 [Rubroshorea leprosula]